MRCPVGPHKSVNVKVSITSDPFIAIVTTICPVFFSIFVCLKKSLVNPVPYETALQLWIFFNNIPIILKITSRIAHGMSVLTHYHRSVFFNILCISFYFRYRCIHIGPDVGVPFRSIGFLFGAFILNRSCYIPFLFFASCRVVLTPFLFTRLSQLFFYTPSIAPKFPLKKKGNPLFYPTSR